MRLPILLLAVATIAAKAAAYDFSAVTAESVTIYYDIIDPEAMTARVVSSSPIDAPTVVIPATVTTDGGVDTYTVTAIAPKAFYYYTNMKSVTIPPTITSIGSGAFIDCFGLKEVRISDLTAWCHIRFEMSTSNPLYYSSTLCIDGEPVDHLIIPEGITEILDYTFWTCSSLKSLTLPSTLTSIGVSAFQGCSGLTAVTIPDTVTSIGESAFNSCNHLTVITLGTSLSAIADYTFYGCRAVNEIHCKSAIPPLCQPTAFLKGPDKATTIISVPEGTVDAYRITPVWTDFTNICETPLSGITDPDLTNPNSANPTGTSQTPSTTLYDLNGRSIRAPRPGHPYIINGKKTVIL